MNRPSGFGDAEAKRILDRAAEIDAQRPMDAKALRDIAVEAGISPASVDQALEELQRGPVAVAKPAPTTLASWLWRRRVLIISLVILVAYIFMRRAVP
jgi:hypothetical protein